HTSYYPLSTTYLSTYPSVTTPPWTSSTLHSLFFFNDTATTEIYTLSLHDALPISSLAYADSLKGSLLLVHGTGDDNVHFQNSVRSEEHTSELQSRGHLVCRLLLEKKKKN